MGAATKDIDFSNKVYPGIDICYDINGIIVLSSYYSIATPTIIYDIFKIV